MPKNLPAYRNLEWGNKTLQVEYYRSVYLDSLCSSLSGTIGGGKLDVGNNDTLMNTP